MRKLKIVCTAILFLFYCCPLLEGQEQLSCKINFTEGISCYGEKDGRIEVEATGGTGSPYTFDIGFDANDTGVFTDLGPGTYDIVITDPVSGESVSCAQVVIASLDSLTADVTQIDVSCYGYSDGSIAVRASGGTPPYTYSNGNLTNTTGDFNNLIAGTYLLAITDANNCPLDFGPVVVGSPEAMSCTIDSIHDVSCFGGSDGSIVVKATGGTAPYTYTTGMATNTTGIFSGLSPGGYNITIIDANDCFSVCDSITIGSPDSLQCEASIRDVSCVGGSDGSIEIITTGGTTPYSFSIGTATNTTGTFTGLSAGFYNILIADANDCQIVCDTLTIGSPDSLRCEAIGTDLTCAGGSDGSIVVRASGGTAPYSYSIGTTTNTSGTFTGLPAGSYSITITDANDCSVECESVEIGSPLAISCEVRSSNDVSCAGGTDGSIVVRATGGTAPYSYSIGTSINTTGTFVGLTPGTYSIAITDANNCSVECRSVEIGSPADISCEVSSQRDVSCLGDSNGSIVIRASGGVVPYKYSLGTATNTTGTFTGLSAGTHLITITDANDCSVECRSVEIGSPLALSCEVTSSNDVSCAGGSDGSFVVKAIGGTAPYRYMIGTATNTTGTFTGLTAGTYNVTIRDANDCVVECRSVEIESPLAISCGVTSSNNVSCAGGSDGSIVLRATGGTAPYSYSIGTSINTTGTFTGLPAGTYRITITDADDCSVECESVKLSQPIGLGCDLIQVTATSCGQNNGSLTVRAFGGTAPYAYSIGSSLTNTSGVFEDLESGTYVVSIIDAKGCSHSCEPTTISNPAALECLVESTTDNFCFDGAKGSIVMHAMGGLAPYSFTLGAITNSTGLFEDLVAGTYTVLVRDSNNCEVQCGGINIFGPEAPLMYKEEKIDQITCSGKADGRIVVSASGGTSPYTYSNGFQSNQTGVFENLRMGSYRISIVDANDCTLETNSIFISAAEEITCELVELQHAHCNMNDGSVLVEASGGAGNYTYMIGEQENSSGHFLELGPGIYVVTIMDGNGCASLCSQLEVLSLTSHEDYYEELIYCEGEQPQYITGSGTYVETVVDESGCSYTLTQEVTIIPPGRIQIDTAICSATSFDIFGLTFDSTGYYEQSFGDCQSVLELNLVFTNVVEIVHEEFLCDGTEIYIGGELVTEAGIYLDTLESRSCDTIVTYQVYEASRDSVEISGDFQICNGIPVTISAGDGYLSYHWSSGEEMQAIEVREAGIYSVDALDSNGCMHIGSIEVHELDKASVSLGEVSDPYDCLSFDGYIALTSDEDLRYSIDRGLHWQSNPTFKDLGYGSYEIWISSEDLTCIQRDAFSVTLGTSSPPFIRDVTVINSCSNGDASLVIQMEDTGDASAYRYSIDGVNYVPSNVFESLADGIYQVSVRNEANACSFVFPNPVEIASFEISEIEILAQQPSCSDGNDGAITLMGEGLENVNRILWNGVSGHTTLNSIQSGTYRVKIEFAPGCSSDYVVDLLDGPVFQVDLPWLTDEIVCPDDSIRLTAHPDYQQVDWIDPTGTYIGSDSSIVVSSAGLYVLATFNDLGCAAYDSVTIYNATSDFTGLQFLMSSEGLVDRPVVAADFSNPGFASLVWIYDREQIQSLSSSDGHEIMMFGAPGTYQVGMKASDGLCTKTIWKEIVIYQDEEDLSNPQSHVALEGFISEFKIEPIVNNGSWMASVGIHGDQDISLFIIDGFGTLVDSRRMSIHDFHIEDYNLTDLPAGVYNAVLMTERDWKYISFRKI